MAEASLRNIWNIRGKVLFSCLCRPPKGRGHVTKFQEPSGVPPMRRENERKGGLNIGFPVVEKVPEFSLKGFYGGKWFQIPAKLFKEEQR